MPYYDLKCPVCGKEKEEFCRYEQLKTEAVRACDVCRAATMELQPPTKTGFILKGSGWYNTDYKGKK